MPRYEDENAIRPVRGSPFGTPFLVHRAHVLQNHALHVSNLLIMEDTPSIALTEFICNLEARVFTFMRSALPIEAEEYGLPKDRTTKK